MVQELFAIAEHLVLVSMILIHSNGGLKNIQMFVVKNALIVLLKNQPNKQKQHEKNTTLHCDTIRRNVNRRND